MRITSGNFNDIANTVNQCRYVNRPQFCVAKSKFAVNIGTHRINVTTITHTRNENCVVVTAADLSDLNVKAANFRDSVRDFLLSDSKLAKIVI